MFFVICKKQTDSQGTHQRVSLRAKYNLWGKINAFIMAFAFSWLSLISPVSMANPTGGVVAGGNVTITQPDANTVNVNQTSNKAIINWQSFNIAPNEATHFQQPSSSSIAVNRVNPNNGSSTIGGRLSANGQIWILNPAGILITPTGRIDAAGFLGTTAGISDADFMNGNYHFLQSPDWHGSVINQGVITVADRGMAALVAPSVSNSGVIQANLGTVALAATNEYVVDFYGDQLIQFGVSSTVNQPGVDENGNAMEDGVSNSGTVIANGGRVLMTADTAAGIVHSAVNVSGTVVANTASVHNGVITLSGGSKGVVRVSGKVMASGAGTGGRGGKIVATGKEVYIDNGALLDASGDVGGGSINIGGNYKGIGPLLNSDYAVIDSDAVVNASALVNGDGGQVILWSDLGTGFYGTIFARGGSEGGNGGFVETSGKEYLEAYGHVYTGAVNGLAGTWLLDPRNVTITTTTSNGTYTAGVGFTPTGNNATVNVASINTDLNAGSSIVINTGSTGGQAGNITVSSGVLKSSGAGTATLTLSAAGAIAINNTIRATSGALDLILTAGGAITQTAALTVAALTITAGANAVTLTNAANVITGAIGITNSGANNVSIRNNTATNLGTISVGAGTFTVTSSGTITQSGSLIQAASAGTASFTAGANAITLTNASNDFTGAVVLSNSGANNISVTDANALSLGASTIGTGSLTLNSVGLTQTGAITQGASAGAVSINAGAGVITLGSSNTFTGAVSLNNSGANDVSLVNSGALSIATSSIGSGALSITAGGSISQTGAITQAAAAGSATFSVSAAASDILLNTQANDFSGSIAFGGTLTNIRDVGLRNVNASAALPSFTGLTNLRNLTIVFNNAALSLPAITLTNSGSFSATAGGAITQTGVLTVPGTASFSAGANAITLTQNNALTGAVTLSNSGANDVQLTNNIATVLAASSVGNNLTISSNGALTQTGLLTVPGLSSFSAGANAITLTQNNALTGAITLSNSGANNVQLTNNIATVLAASSVGNNLTISSNGALTQTGILTVPGTASFSAGANAITLTQNNALTGAITLSNSGANNVQLTNNIATVLAASTVGNNLTISSNGALTQTGLLTVPGLSSFSAGANAITLTQNNVLTGAITLSNSGANDVQLTNNRATILAASSLGNNLTLISNGALTQTGVLTVPGTSSFSAGANAITLTQNNVLTGAVSLSNSGANNVSLINSIALALGSSSLGSGTLSITAGGSITETGAITQAAAAGTATFSVSAAASDILLNTQANNFSGSIAFGGTLTNIRDVGLRNINASATLASFAGLTNLRNLTIVFNNSALSLPAITLTSGGSFSGTAGGAITQTGVLTVPGTSSFSAGANAITLTQNNALTGAVTLSNSGANNVQLTNNIATVLAASSVGNNLTVISNGALTQTGVLTVPGTSSFNAGANAITLTQNNVLTGAVSLSNSGANNVSLINSIALALGSSSLGSGTLSITAGGSITETGAITQAAAAGAATFSVSAAASDILLNTQANNFSGAVGFGGTVSNIRDVGLRNVNSGASVPSLTGLTNLRNLTLVFDNAALSLPAITLTSGGSFSGTAGGAITQSGVLTVPGTASFSAGANAITLTQNNALTGAVTLSNSGANNVQLTNNIATVLAASSVGNNLTVISNGALTQTGVLTVPGTSSFSAGANAITLTQNNVLTGAVSLSNSGANDVQLTNNRATVLATSGVGNNLTVISNGALTQTGALTVPGLSSFSAGANAITLSQNNVLTGAVSLSNSGANNVSLVNSIALVLGASNVGSGTLGITAGGSITETGAITQAAAAGAATFSVSAAASDILLNTQANNFSGSIGFGGTLTNIRDVGLRNINASATLASFAGLTNLRNLTIVFNNSALSLPAITLSSGGSFSGTAGGAITQSGVLTVPGTASFSAGANAITLTQNNALTGAVTLSNSGANNVQLTNNIATVLAASSVGNNLTVISNGALTQTGVLTVPGTSSFSAGANAITLTQNNVLTGAVSLSNSGANDVQLTNNRATVLATSGVGNHLTVISNGALTQTGALTVPGLSSFSAGANAITLSQNNVLTGAVSLSNSGANNVSLVNSIALVLGASNVGSGTLSITAGGSITETGAITQAAAAGAATFSVSAAASDILLNTQANNFSGAIGFGGTLANIRDVGLRNVNASASLGSFAGLTNLRNLTIQFDNSALSLPTITLTSGGSFSGTAGGAITQTGVLTVPGTSSFSSGANAMTLTQNNALTGAVTLSNSGANNVQLTNNIATVLAASSVGNNLTVISNGALTQTGALTVPGVSSFSVGANAITLTNANNDFTGAVALNNSGVNNVSLTDVNGLVIGASSVGAGSLTLNSVGVTQTGAITQAAAAGDAIINAGAGVITLNNASNHFTGDVFLNNSGANNVALVNNTLLSLGTSVLGSGTLSLASTGEMSQVGAITQAASAGAVTLTQNLAGADIFLDTAANDFSGSMSFGGALSNIHEFSLRNINSGASLPTNLAGLSSLFNLTLQFDNAGMSFPALSVANNLSAIAGGAISQTGALTVGGTSSFSAGNHAITLTSANAFTDDVSLSNSGANNVAVTNTINLVLGTVNVGSGTLGLTGVGVSQSGVITQAASAGRVTVNAGAGVIALGNNNVFTSDVSLNNTGANDVSLTDTTPLVLAASNVGSGALNLVSGGSLSETGALVQESNAGTISVSLTVPNSDILMDTQPNDTNGSIIIAGTTANLRDVARRNINANAGTLISNIGLLTNLRNLTIIFDNSSLIAQAVTLHNGGNLYVDTSGSLSGGTGGSIAQTGVVTVPGTTTLLTGDHPITLTQNNLLTGVISLSNSGANDVSVTNAQATVLGASSVGRNLSVVSNGAITQTGVLTVPGTSSFSAGANAITLTQANAFTGAVSLSNSGANNASLINSMALSLGASTIGQNLSLTAGGSIIQTGAVTATGGTTTVATTVAGSDILLGSFANDLGTSALIFGGTASNIRDLSLRNVNAGAIMPSFASLTNLRNLTVIFNNTAMVLPAISLVSGGSISMTAGGSITQTGALTVPGTASFTTGASPITLTNASNSIAGAISVFNSGALNVSLRNNIATVLGTSSVGNNLTVLSNGAITQTGILTVPQLSSFTAGANPITLTLNNVLTGAVSLNNSGANDVQLTNVNALVIGTSSIGSGALALTAGGTISQTGAITQEANAAVATFTFTAPDSDLLLTTSTPNYFTSNFNVGGTLANLRDFSIWSAGTGDSVVLNLLLLTNLRNVTLIEDNLANLTIPALTLHNGGNLSINTSGVASGGTGGNIIQTGAITIPGTTNLNAGAHSIIFTENNQFTGAVSLNNTGANNVSLTNAIALNLGSSNVGSGTLTINGLGVTQTGALIQEAGAGAVNINAGAGVITLTQASNSLVGAVTLTNSGANNVSLVNDHDLSLAASSVGSGTLDITAVGDITQTGAFIQAASAGAASFNAGSHAITLTQANQFTGAVSLDNSGANNVSLSNSIALALGTSSVGSGTLNITAGGNITQTGALTQAVGAGDVSVSAGSHGIALTQTNHLTGNIALTNSGANDVALTNDTGVSFNASSLGSGAFTVIAGGAITQLGTITQAASAGNTSFSAGANAITLGLTNHLTGPVIFSNSGNHNISLVNDTLLTLGASSVGSGTLSLSGVGVTQTGALTQALSAGAITVNAGAGLINLSNAGNQFTGTLAVNNSGANNVSLVNNNPLSLAASSLGSGTLSITANGTLNQTGAITQASGAGAITLTQNASGADILLNTAANNFSGAIAFGGTLGNIRDFGLRNINSGATLPSNLSGLSSLRNLTLTFNNAAMSLPALTASGNMSITANGSITQTGALSVTGTPTFTTTAISSDILLASNANNFAVTPVITNNGNVRDLALRNTAATAVVPSLPTGMRNLTLSFDNAGMVLPALAVTGNITASANGAITQSGALNMDGSGTVLTLTAGSGNDITLTDAGNFIEELRVISGRNVSVVNADISDFSFGASTISGTLSLNASSPITQTGAVTVLGAATLATDASKNITLTNAANDFTSLGITSGNDVSITDANDLALNASTISGNLNVITQGNLTQNGVIANAGSGAIATFAANSGNITLANAANDFHQININSANDVSLADANALVFGLTSVAGNLTVATNGNITQVAGMSVNGLGKVASFDAGATGNVTLTHVPNDFTAITIPHALTVNVLDVNDLDIGDVLAESNFTSQVGGSLTTTGLIQSMGGDVNLSTTGAGTITIGPTDLNVDGIVTTASGGTTSGNIIISAANTGGLPTALTVNRVLNTTGGSGGVLSVGGGVSVNETPLLGAGSITLSANSDETFLGNLNFTVPTVIQYSNTDIVINGAIVTTGIGSSLSIIADANNSGIGGIRSTATGSVNSSGDLTLQASNLISSPGTAIFLIDGSTFTAAGDINVLGNIGSNLIHVHAALESTGAGKSISLTPTGTADIDFGGSLTTNGGAINLNGNPNSSFLVHNDIALTTNGGLINANAISSAGHLITFDVGSGTNLTLTNAANNFDSVAIVSAKDVSLVDVDSLNLEGSTISGDLTLSTGGDITNTTGNISVAGATTLTALNNGSITLAQAGNDFTSVSVSAANNLSLVDANAIDLGPITVAGTLSVASAGNITQVGGAIIANTVGKQTSLSAGSGFDITLDQADNDFYAIALMNSRDAVLRDTNALILASITLSGNLDLTTGGAITQNNAMTLSGAGQTATITAGATNNITLNNSGNNIRNMVINSGKDVSVINGGNLNFGASTISGNLVTHTNGYTQTGALTVLGSSTFNGDSGSIILGGANQFSGPVLLLNAGNNNVALNNVGLLTIGGGTSTLGSGTVTLSGLGVTQTGAITQEASAGDVTINAGAGIINLANAGNDFTGSVLLNNSGANNVALTDSSALDLGTSSVGSGSLALVSGGNITQSGVLSQASGAGAITLSSTVAASDIDLSTQANLLTGPLSFGGTLGNIRDVAIRNASSAATAPSNLSGLSNLRNLNLVFNNAAIDLPSATLTSGGVLSVTANGISQSGVLTVPGTSSFIAGNNAISLSNANAFTGAITLSNSGASNNVALTNTIATVLAASSVGHDLSIVSNGAITQTGVLTVPGASSFSAGANVITLTQNNAFTGAVSLSNSGANNVSVMNNGGLTLGTTSVGRALNLTVAGNVTQSGVITATGGSVTITSTVANTDIALGSFANDFGSQALTFGGSLANIRDISLRNISSSAAFPSLAGLINIRNLTLTFDAAAITVPTLTLTNSGNLSLVSGGDITQTGVITVPGTSNISALNHAITLTNASNAFTGAVTLTNSGNHDVALRNAGLLTLATSSVGSGSLSLTGTGLTQTGAITQAASAGAVTLNAGAGAINFNQANQFTGAVALQNNGNNNITLSNALALDLGASSVGTGTLGVTAGGSITESGALVQALNAGAITLAVTAPNSDILLNTQANNLSGVLSYGGTTSNIRDVGYRNVNTAADANGLNLFSLSNLRNATVIFDNSAVTLPALTLHAGGNLYVDASGSLSGGTGGAITQTGVAVVPGTTTLLAGGHVITINQNNAFTGAISLSNTGSNDVSVKNTIATALAASSIGRNLSINSGGAITQSGVLTVPGTSSFTAGANAITLSQTNVFTGAVSLSNTGANDIQLTNANALVLGTTNIGSGSVGLTAGGTISQVGAITQEANAGIMTFTFTAPNSDLLLSTTVPNDISSYFNVGGTLGNLRDVSIWNAGVSGGVVLNLQLLTNLRNLTVTYDNVPEVSLPELTLHNGGSLIVNTSGTASGGTGGNITQTGALTIPGTTTLTAGAHSIVMTENNQFSGAVTLSNTGANNISLTNAIALNLGTSNVGSGTLTLSGLGVTQSGGIIQEVGAGAVTINGGAGAIALSNAANNFAGDVSLNNSGANNVAIRNGTSLSLGTSSVGSGTLSLIAGGNLAQTGAITQAAGAGAITLTSTVDASNITLDQANVLTGSMSIGGNVTFIHNLNLRNVFSGASLPTNLSSLSDLRNLTLTFDNAGVNLPALTLFTGGNLSITTGGAITQSGALTVPGTTSLVAGNHAITLTQNNVLTGVVSLSNSGANNVALKTSGLLTLGTATLGSGSLSLTGLGITQSGASTLTQAANAGAATFNAGAGIISLANNNAFTGTVSLNNSGVNNVTLKNTNPLVLATSSLGAGLLTLTSGGNITQTGAITQASGAANVRLASTAANADILLNTAANDFSGSVVFIGTMSNIRDVGIRNINANASFDTSITSLSNLRNLTLVLDNAALSLPAVTLHNAGSLNATSGGAITQTGALVANAVNATASGGILLTNAGNAINQITATNNTSGDISLVSTINPLLLNAITNNGSGNINVSVTGGDIHLANVLTTNGGDITLNSPLVLTGAASLISHDGLITFNGVIDGAHALTLNAGANGDITFNEDLGSTTPLSSLVVSNAHDVINNASMSLGQFTQSAGHLLSLGAGGLSTTGNASITSGNVTGQMNVASLSLGTNLANITGLIAGGSGVPAIKTVVFLNTITAGTHFFNGIDMYLVPPTPPTPPTPTNNTASNLPQTTLPDGIAVVQPGYTTPNTDAWLAAWLEGNTVYKNCTAVTNDIAICNN